MKRREFIKLASSTIAALSIPFNIFKENSSIKIGRGGRSNINTISADYFVPNELWKNTRTNEIMRVSSTKDGLIVVNRTINDKELTGVFTETIIPFNQL